MTHTSPEREELADILYEVELDPPVYGYTRDQARKLAHVLTDAGYRRLPIDQARVGEIRELVAACRRLITQAGDASGFDTFKCQDVKAVSAYLLSLLEDTKVEAPAGAPTVAWRDDAIEQAAQIVERYAGPENVNAADIARDIRGMKSGAHAVAQSPVPLQEKKP